MTDSHTAVGFDAVQRRTFRAWVRLVTGSDPTEAQIQAYWDSNEFKDFSSGQNLHIEVLDRWGNPQVFGIDPDHVIYADKEEEEEQDAPSVESGA